MTTIPHLIRSEKELEELLARPENAPTRAMLEQHDFVLRSDGSAIHQGEDPPYLDDFGGSACFTASDKFTFRDKKNSIFDFSSATGMDTNRAELWAGLMGLRRVHQALKDHGRLSAHERATVLWVTDRENLVMGTNNAGSRKSDRDFWSLFAYYEQFLNITAEHVKRDVGGIHAIVDRVSADQRALAISYARQQSLRPDLPA